MNETVARIVDLLFEDIEENDEVQAIHDEVMNNCQERFDDLVKAGMGEDEAIAAVVESLKGMDEMLSSYPRKNPQPVAAEEQCGAHVWKFSPEQVREILINAQNSDVTIEVSEDDMIAVEVHDERVRVSSEDGKLSIVCSESEKTSKEDKKHTFKFDYDKPFNLETIFQSLSRSFERLSRSLENVGTETHIVVSLPQVHMQSLVINTSSGDVDALAGSFETVEVHTAYGDICVEDVSTGKLAIITTSGDVEVDHCTTGDMSISTTNGDVEVNNGEEQTMERLQIRTTSGDIDCECFAKETTVTTISGDVEMEGRLGRSSFNTTSGDLTVRADMDEVIFRTVSGDVELTCDDNALRSITGHTVSGDVQVRLPGGIEGFDPQLRSTSGDVSYRASCPMVQGSLPVRITTVSGDIELY